MAQVCENSDKSGLSPLFPCRDPQGGQIGRFVVSAQTSSEKHGFGQIRNGTRVRFKWNWVPMRVYASSEHYTPVCPPRARGAFPEGQASSSVMTASSVSVTVSESAGLRAASHFENFVLSDRTDFASIVQRCPFPTLLPNPASDRRNFRTVRPSLPTATANSFGVIAGILLIPLVLRAHRCDRVVDRGIIAYPT